MEFLKSWLNLLLTVQLKLWHIYLKHTAVKWDTEHIVIYEAAYKYSAKNVKLKIKYHWQNVNNNPKYSNHHQRIKKKGPGFKNRILDLHFLTGPHRQSYYDTLLNMAVASNLGWITLYETKNPKCQ